MKKLLFYLTLFFLISCTKSDPVVEKTIADFEAVTADTLGNFEVKFTNKSKNATSFLWDFGNGKRSTDKDPKHKYTEGGIFTVRLSATGLNGTDRITRSIYILNKPLANFDVKTCDSTTYAPCEAVFINKSVNTKNYLWDFGDGKFSTEENPRHQYEKGGVFTVQLTATGSEGTDKTIKTVYIALAPVPPTANFEMDGGNCVAPCEIIFTNISKNASSYFWDFGDGSRSVEISPKHSYKDGGIYLVRMTAKGKGGSQLAQRTVSINFAPTASFEVENSNCLSPCPVQFTNRSTNAILYSWDFGDRQSSTETNPSHTFMTAGTYRVILKAIGAENRSMTVSKTISIR